MSNQEALNEIMMSCVMVLSDRIKFEKAINIAMEALRKQIPMEVKEIHVDEYFCPACGEQNNCGDICLIGDSYCPKCGQALYQVN